MAKKEYDLIIPIGTDCGASMWLRALNLQVQSYPFDWVTGVALNTKAQLVLNDCKNYLNQESLVFVEKWSHQQHDALCDYYKSTDTNILFMHDFPIGKPLSETYPLVWEKYHRRIERMYQDLKQAKRILFFWFLRIEKEGTPDESLLLFQKECSKKLGKPVDLLVLENDPQLSGTLRVEKKSVTPHILRYYLDTATSIPPEQAVLGNGRLIEPILREYALSIPTATKLWMQLKGPLVRAASLLIMNKDQRKKFRKKYHPEYQYHKNLKDIHRALKKQKGAITPLVHK